MDSTPEQEQPKKERVIKLGEEFQLFDPKYGIKKILGTTIADTPYYYYKNSVHLNISEDIKLPFSLTAMQLKRGMRRWFSVTPFTPEAGYNIDQDDLRLETRIKKMNDPTNKLEKIINTENAALSLNVHIEGALLHKLGFNQLHKDAWPPMPYYQFYPETIDLFRKLRLIVSFPASRFEGKPEEPSLNVGSLFFFNFYPLDSGPLPTTPALEESGRMYEGFLLCTPDDPEKLAQIRGRFVFAPEEPNEGGEK